MNIKLAQRIGCGAWVALAALQVVWHAWWLPPQRMPTAIALLIALLPLALPLFYWRVPQRALLAAGMVALFYFCHGVAEAWSAPLERAPALIEIALALLLIGSLARKPRKKHQVSA
ncbi:MAG TPA: DUF2069 domain-containing protein [Rhodanobacteraceae bacterium]|nr:DUF2069 domain-containing protein [Rhodanobacteraceae bacterium]